MIQEFKKFIASGNVIDFAVGVIMAGAIAAVLNSFVGDILMPVIGYLIGGPDFSAAQMVLKPEVLNADGSIATAAVSIKYGAWINSIISLFTIGLALFFMVKGYNKMRTVETPPPAGPSDIDLLTEIRDLLKK